jgi:hypothetical protein
MRNPGALSTIILIATLAGCSTSPSDSGGPDRGGAAGNGGAPGSGGAVADGGHGGAFDQAAGGQSGGGSAGGAGGSTSVMSPYPGVGGNWSGEVQPTGTIIKAAGATVTIQSGALQGTANVTVTVENPPPGYDVVTPTIEIGPPSLVFAQPINVEVGIYRFGAMPHLFWSNADGGFDDIGGALFRDYTLSGAVPRPGRGFGAVPHPDDGGTSGD